VRISRSFDDVLASRGHVRVLRALDALPEGLGVSARDVARRAGVAHNRASEVLADLNRLGIARVQRAGRADLYQLSRQHVLHPAIHELFAREAEVQAEMARHLRARLTRLKRVREAVLFGSAARGDAREASDIDLAVVIPPAGPTTQEQAQLEEVATSIRERFGGRLSVHVSPRSVAERAKGRTGRALWRRIAAEGVRLVPKAD
jgi:predicted nucleotidyltransferase